MESQIKGSELLVDGRVEDPIQIKRHEFFSVFVSHRQRLPVFLEVESLRLAIFFEGNLAGKEDFNGCLKKKKRGEERGN